METGGSVSEIAIQDWGSIDEVKGRILKALGTQQTLECPDAALPEERDGTVTSSPQEGTKSLHVDRKGKQADIRIFLTKVRKKGENNILHASIMKNQT